MNLPNNDGSNKDDTAFMNMEVVSGTYQFKVQYSKTQNFPKDETITSPIFKVNGHKCEIIYLPRGSEETIELWLQVLPKSEKVTVSVTLGLLDKYGRPSSKACTSEKMITCDPDLSDECYISHSMERSELEAHFVRDGCFTLVCSITILDEFYKEVPKRFVNGIMPFSIDEHFVQLLDRKETADVKFEVEGEIFSAHRSILAARSPVFNAELFGSMVESKTKTITIKDMKGAVFKAMLHFIYTDSLPDMSDDNIPLVTMTQHLLVAADRYALDGLKMLCQDSLMRDITMDTALSTLTVAEELDLKVLKDKCICFVSDPKNLLLFSVKHDYVQLMVRYPSLLEDISHKGIQGCSLSLEMLLSKLDLRYSCLAFCFHFLCITILNEFYKEVPKRFVNGIMPFSIDEHFVQLLNRKETADVIFEVEREIFTAHRLVLAARSPVCNAELFIPMAERKIETKTVKVIKPAVVKAMLYFIYSHLLSDISDENIPLVTMTQHLLVAADRYALDGLKMLCQDSLMNPKTLFGCR